MINILYEDNHIIVVEKPINVPVQADDSNDPDLLTMLKQYIKEKYEKPGNVYLGLVHRLDRPVGGVMVFAKTSKAASRLSAYIADKNKFKKEYYAVVCGKGEKHDKLEDYLLKDNKTNMTKVDKNGKYSLLEYETISFVDNYSLVKIDLKTGRSHQIRVQFSSRGIPLYGDQKYNKFAIPGEQIALFAKKLTFIHPVKKCEMTFELDLPKRKPWSFFKEV